MLLTETEARAICEKLLSYVKADDAVVGVNSENYGHLRFASNAFTTSGARENVSVGVACTTRGETLTHGELIRRADEKLYQAKNQGRNRVAI